MLKKIHFVPIAIVFLLIIPFFSFAKADKSNLPLKTVYHVKINGKEIGTVSEKEIVEEAIQQKITQLEKQYPQLTFSAPKITYEAERTSHLVADDASVKQIHERLKIKANAVTIMFGEHSVAVKNKTDANKVIEQLKSKYVPSLQPKEQTNILDVSLSTKPVIKEAKVEPENVLSVEDAVNYVAKGTLEEQIHTVREGEVLSTIAKQYNLTTEQILLLNPDIKVDSLLQIGQKLNVTVYQPLVDVIVKEQARQIEEIPYEIEAIPNEKMYKGDIKVTQEGKNGQKEVLYQLTKKNGQIVKKEVINETIIEEPVKKIVIKGTKVLSSRGTGRFAWPTVGGYISSRMGYRWGEFHKGTDIAGSSSSPILAADNGTVTFAGWDGDYGNKVVINHRNGFKTVYAHMNSITVKRGQTVAKGSKIGTMGSTGESTGTHLHIELYNNGKLVNFLQYLR
ncbi:murein DD-endopeptidase MepM/ murein hydrolase activator NlpD [Anoxybacillus tepidamans]|uniref:Murein DD-endopeptidase MepM/ murein hydrolase activator NlpD n=1 Tax=Anoxybacteroides tepidamans TaxID=265948 RepID=A0A7W8IMX1_9BACL|nr:M23 family metallopeptidase [Anoxybacillus tepidamans]MBB5323526.1 murein DD-endopeptidase MepM/ murein hydrolase activator NlpD [Anoxybacillus tepidamans]